MEASSRSQQCWRQIHRRAEPCGLPESEYRDEIAAERKRARATAQQINGIENAHASLAFAAVKVDFGRHGKLIATRMPDSAASAGKTHCAASQFPVVPEIFASRLTNSISAGADKARRNCVDATARQAE